LQAPRHPGLAARPRGTGASAGRHGQATAWYERAAIPKTRDRAAETPNHAAADMSVAH
jgi:hypothetical protein